MSMACHYFKSKYLHFAFDKYGYIKYFNIYYLLSYISLVLRLVKSLCGVRERVRKIFEVGKDYQFFFKKIEFFSYFR